MINRLLEKQTSVVALGSPEETVLETYNKKTVALDDHSLVLLIDCSDKTKLEIICRNICNNLNEPIHFNNLRLDLSINAGYVFVAEEHCAKKTTQENPLEEIVRKARIAAKLCDKHSTLFHEYKEEEDHFSPSRLALAGELRDAINSNELSLVYQPQINLRTGSVFGIETLVRWHHKDGQVNTEEFISLAEQNGIIKILTIWVVNQSLKDFHEISKVRSDIQLSINISVLNLYEPEFVDQLLYALLLHNIDSNKITLEVTETSLLSNGKQESSNLQRIREAGIKLSIDDYGTGYSGLSQIHTLNANELKLDRSFINNLCDDHKSRKIVKASIDMSQDLGMKVVAEGIESEGIEEVLKEMGCDIGQGYLYARPMEKETLINYLAPNVLSKHSSTEKA